MSLAEINRQWIGLYRELENDRRLATGFLAGLFLPAAPDGWLSRSRKTLLVGKATRGDCDRADFLQDRSVEWCQRSTREFLECVCKGGYSSQFWNFAWNLNRAVDEVDDHFGNLIWSNIAKIGVTSGNPEGLYFSLQRELALITLQAEIEEYKPSLIVFVTGNYQSSVIYELIAGANDASWHKENGEDGFWYRHACERLPAVLWTGHPERKKREIVESWLNAATELLT